MLLSGAKHGHESKASGRMRPLRSTLLKLTSAANSCWSTRETSIYFEYDGTPEMKGKRLQDKIDTLTSCNLHMANDLSKEREEVARLKFELDIAKNTLRSDLNIVAENKRLRNALKNAMVRFQYLALDRNSTVVDPVVGERECAEALKATMT
jgi:hypothetical protein